MIASTIKKVSRACIFMVETWRRGSKDRKSTRLNSSHSQISYAVFCLKKKNINRRLRHAYKKRLGAPRFSMILSCQRHRTPSTLLLAVQYSPPYHPPVEHLYSNVLRHD